MPVTLTLPVMVDALHPDQAAPRVFISATVWENPLGQEHSPSAQCAQHPSEHWDLPPDPSCLTPG